MTDLRTPETRNGSEWWPTAMMHFHEPEAPLLVTGRTMTDCTKLVVLIVFLSPSSSLFGQGKPLPVAPISRIQSAAAETDSALKSGTGHGLVTFQVGGKVVEQIGFQSTILGRKYALTLHYPQPRKGKEAITRQTMVSDGTLTFATQFADRLSRDGYTTDVWRDGKPVGRTRGFGPPNYIFQFDVARLHLRPIDLPRVLQKYDVKVVSSDEAETTLTYTLTEKTRCTFSAAAHSGFNVTELNAVDDDGLAYVCKVGWERQKDVWFVRRFYEKYPARPGKPAESGRPAGRAREDEETTLEYQDFQPNVDVDEKTFDLSRVEDGWYNERLMYPHGKP